MRSLPLTFLLTTACAHLAPAAPDCTHAGWPQNLRYRPVGPDGLTDAQRDWVHACRPAARPETWAATRAALPVCPLDPHGAVDDDGNWLDPAKFNVRCRPRTAAADRAAAQANPENSPDCVATRLRRGWCTEAERRRLRKAPCHWLRLKPDDPNLPEEEQLCSELQRLTEENNRLEDADNTDVLEDYRPQRRPLLDRLHLLLGR